MKKIRLFVGIAAVLFATISVTGCGGGGDSNQEQSSLINITRTTEGTFSESARILAAREAEQSGDIWIKTATARGYDMDLAVIRKVFPEVAEIGAHPDYVLRSVLVTLSPDASWARGWSTTDLATGEPELDALLRKYSLEKIRHIGNHDNDTPVVFVLEFGQSLNARALTKRIREASAKIAKAEANAIGGDGIGSNIVRKMTGASDGTRRYIFTQGLCQGACIQVVSWEFAVSADGTAATLLQKVGGPLK